MSKHNSTTIFRVFLIVFSFFIHIEEQRCNTIDFQKDSLKIKDILKSARNNSLKDFQKAIVEANMALELALQLKDNTLLFATHRAQGRIYEDNNYLTHAYYYYEKALSYQDFVRTSLKLDIYLDWAIINKKLSKYNITRDYYQRTLNLAFKENDLEMVEYVYSGLGTLNCALGEFDKAIDYHLQSKEISEKRANTVGVITSLINISTAYMKSKNYKLAYHSLEQGNNLAYNIKDTMRIAYIANIFGKVLNAEKKHTEAIIYHQKALKYSELVENKAIIAQTLGLIADVYTQMGQYDNAENTFKRCFEYSSFFDFYEQPNLYFLIGNLYLKTKRPKDAAHAFNQSLDLASKRGFIDLMQKTNRGLVDVYQQLGDSKRALKYIKIAKIYEDSIFNSDKIQRIAEAQFKFDRAKAEAQQKLDMAEDEKEIQELKLTQNRIMLGLMSILLFSVLIFSVFYIQQKNKNNYVLYQKNIEILSKNSRLEKSNEVLQQFAYASAHDLKEPLRSISGFVTIIDRKYAHLLPPESSEFMNFVVGGVKRMESLIGALLEYSTIASDEEDIKQSTPILRILDEVKENLNTIILDKQAKLEFLGYLPSLRISRLHLTQLLQNLIGNAIKFTEREPLVQIKGKQKANQYIIEIKDNGIGMEAEHSEKIFHLFQRLSRTIEGTGIGLSICKEIVNKYEGTITFESTKHIGTTFIISFPSDLIDTNIS